MGLQPNHLLKQNLCLFIMITFCLFVKQNNAYNWFCYSSNLFVHDASLLFVLVLRPIWASSLPLFSTVSAYMASTVLRSSYSWAPSYLWPLVPSLHPHLLTPTSPFLAIIHLLMGLILLDLPHDMNFLHAIYTSIIYFEKFCKIVRLKINFTKSAL